MKPHLYKRGMGWYCEGNGVSIFASTPKLAYDHWEFATMTGYRYMHALERQGG